MSTAVDDDKPPEKNFTSLGKRITKRKCNPITDECRVSYDKQVLLPISKQAVMFVNTSLTILGGK